MFSFILVVCLAGVFSLAPFALYLLWLVTLNRRDRPTVVAGRWDFAALLGGLSGFVLFGGGLLLTLLQSNVRYWMRGNFESLRQAWNQEQVAWTLVAAAYLIVVVGGALLTLAARRRTLVIYNIDPGQFESLLGEVFEHSGRAVERRGNVWAAAAPLLELEPFPAGRSVAVRWLTADTVLTQEVERQIRSAVPSLSAAESQPARWLMTGAVGSLSVVVFCVVLLLYGLSVVR